MKEQLRRSSLTISPHFPKLWNVVLDDIIPTFVKKRFSPQQSWKLKPFSQEDVAFFSKGLQELSDFFTEDRPRAKLPNYFTTAKFRSSYFLYFFPLQGAKFLTLLDRHPDALDAAIASAKKTGTLSVSDWGSGPGTASIALLVAILDRFQNETKIPFKIELHWVDHNESILEDGKVFFAELLQGLSAKLPDLDADIELRTEARPWWKHPTGTKFESTLHLFGNVLNESASDPRAFQTGLAPLLKKIPPGGVLFVEPATRVASQRLSQIRDEFLELQPKASLFGPCLHSGRCPLSTGRDWCHFSVPAELPGKLFRQFSIRLGSVREWLKFSFVWLAPESATAAIESQRNGIARIISNPMKTKFGEASQVCRPEKIEWISKSEAPRKLERGDVVPETALKRRSR